MTTYSPGDVVFNLFVDPDITETFTEWTCDVLNCGTFSYLP